MIGFSNIGILNKTGDFFVSGAPDATFMLGDLPRALGRRTPGRHLGSWLLGLGQRQGKPASNGLHFSNNMTRTGKQIFHPLSEKEGTLWEGGEYISQTLGGGASGGRREEAFFLPEHSFSDLRATFHCRLGWTLDSCPLLRQASFWVSWTLDRPSQACQMGILTMGFGT